jgi:site-specific DNA-methyltransferase (adenine-specific)
MKPYYEHGGVTIYHADCRDLLPDLWFGVDLLLTDPPYGIGYDARGGTGPAAPRRTYSLPTVCGDDAPFDPRPLLNYGAKAILWGGNHFADRLPASATWLVWDKREGTAPNSFADCELAWSNLGGPARLFHHRWLGMLRASEKDEERVHPTQKPVALMSWCLSLVPDARLVLDPYMGSGSTIKAAKERGLRAIGIEIEERYCEIAANRLSQEVLAFA